MNQSPRGLSKAIHRGDLPPQFATLEELKASHYAALGHAIEVLLDDVLSKRAERPPHGFILSPSTEQDPWILLDHDSTMTFNDSIQAIVDHPAVYEAHRLNWNRANFSNYDPMRVDLHLLSGAATASGVMLTLLRNFDSIVRYHRPDYDETSLPDIARRSYRLPNALAMLSINQLGMTHKILSGVKEGARERLVELNPEYFKLVGDDEPVIDFDDLRSWEIPDELRFEPELRFSDRPRHIGEIASKDSVVIGCPVNHLPLSKREELWNWYIEVVDAQNLWRV